MSATLRPGAAGVRKKALCVFACPSVCPICGRLFQFGFRSFTHETVPDVKCTCLFYNQDACNQEIYVADVGVQSLHNNHDRNRWRARGVCELGGGRAERDPGTPGGKAPHGVTLVSLTINPVKCIRLISNPLEINKFQPLGTKQTCRRMIKSLARVHVEGMEPEHQPTKVAFIPNSGVATCGPGCREIVGVFGIGRFHSSEGSIVILDDSVV